MEGVLENQDDTRLKIAKRNIVLMMIGKLSSMLGANVYTFAMGLYVLKTTGSGMGFAITLVCGSVPRMICGPIAGAAADRMNRKRLAVGADVLSAFIMFTMFLLSTSFGLSLIFIYVSAALLSICASFFSIALTSSIPSLVDTTRIQKANSLNQTATSLATILGPVIGGLVYGLFSMKFFFLLNGITFALAAMIEVFMVFDLYKANKKEEKDHFLTSIKEGFIYVKEQSDIFSMLKLSLWLNFFFCAVSVSLPYIIVQKLSLSSQQFGVIEAMLAVGMLIASILLSVRAEATNKFQTIRRNLFMLAGLLLCIALPMFLPLTKTMIFIYYITLMTLFGVNLIMINVPLQVFVQKTTAPEYLGRVFGLIETMSTAIVPLGTLLYGLLLDYIPASTVIFISAFGLFVVVFLGTKQWKDMQEGVSM
ncbi:MFS transporter [Bacillus cereus group sp. BfR-BA-01380]|uniref:MFS transporter n=1 Tax=Bacillus cereus group sp. BfR-BA-01380 TaxID=2920324 RepID=UPI001F562A7E|nr:MFS transporter [Bacillus cereus group sp. BfR-BA-01380]